jgi:hypothetical protein
LTDNFFDPSEGVWFLRTMILIKKGDPTKAVIANAMTF